MKQAVKKTEVIPIQPHKPALTPEERENELIALTLDRVEERIRNGTATSQELCHFLKLATTKEKLEKDKLVHENELLKAKTANLASLERMEVLYEDAIKSMRMYSGNGSTDEEEEDNDSNLY